MFKTMRAIEVKKRLKKTKKTKKTTLVL